VVLEIPVLCVVLLIATRVAPVSATYGCFWRCVDGSRHRHL